MYGSLRFARNATLGFSIVAAALGYSSTASAVLMLSADINGTSFQAVDNGVGDTDPTIGTLALASQTVAGVVVLGTVETSLHGTNNVLSSSSLSITNVSGSARSARVVVSDTDYAGPATTAFTTGSGTFTLAAGSTIDRFFYNDPANAQGAENIGDTPGNLIDSGSFTAVGPVSSFALNGGPFAVDDPDLFSMTLAFDLDLVAGGAACSPTNPTACPALISRGQSEIKPQVVAEVPEPATLTLLGAGLLAFGTFVSRRRRT
jgi:hypothetical protein